jgi:hypothetical protein
MHLNHGAKNSGAAPRSSIEQSYAKTLAALIKNEKRKQ